MRMVDITNVLRPLYVILMDEVGIEEDHDFV